MNTLRACAPTIEHPMWCTASMCQASTGGPHLREVETILDGQHPDDAELVITLSQMPDQPAMVVVERWRGVDRESAIEFPVAAARCVIGAVSGAMWAAMGSPLAVAS